MSIITPTQCRAGRTVLGWHQSDLAKASKVGAVTIRLFETGKHTPKESSLTLLRMAFEKAGIVFGADGDRDSLSWVRRD